MLRLLWDSLAQTADPGSVNWNQIGAGALIAAPAYTIVLVLWRAFSKLNAEFRALLEKVVPLLAQAVDTLAQTPDKLDKALADAQGAAKAERLDSLLRELQETIDKRKT